MVMKKLFLFLVILTAWTSSFAQDANQLHETARTFMKQGDFANAVLVLNHATQLDPGNIEISKDLALNYYFEKNYNKALDIIKPVLENDNADDQAFQIAGDIYQALSDLKETEKVYKKGLKKFPHSGPLYNEYGEMLWAKQDYTAIKQWEKGIEEDPGFSRNYYNASKYYYFTTDKVWSIIYGEIFLNIEPMGSTVPEVKNILLESYKKLFSEADLEASIKDKNDFVKAYIKTMNKQSSIASHGINPETLTMIRTRFILDWYTEYASKFPSRLFDMQRQLLQGGMFNAYNQWIFGIAQNLATYQNWTNTHTDEYSEFSRFQKGRIFKIPPGQYYH